MKIAYISSNTPPHLKYSRVQYTCILAPVTFVLYQSTYVRVPLRLRLWIHKYTCTCMMFKSMVVRCKKRVHQCISTSVHMYISVVRCMRSLMDRNKTNCLLRCLRLDLVFEQLGVLHTLTGLFMHSCFPSAFLCAAARHCRFHVPLSILFIAACRCNLPLFVQFLILVVYV